MCSSVPFFFLLGITGQTTLKTPRENRRHRRRHFGLSCSPPLPPERVEDLSPLDDVAKRGPEVALLELEAGLEGALREDALAVEDDARALAEERLRVFSC